MHRKVWEEHYGPIPSSHSVRNRLKNIVQDGTIKLQDINCHNH